jgi:hypothetical protein
MKHIVNYTKWTLISEAEIFNKEKGGKFQALFDIGMTIVTSLIKDHGFSPIVAAAITGNIFLESKFNPNILSSSGHYGLIQWGGDRKIKLKKLASSNTVETQLKFIAQELNGLYSKVLVAANAATSIEEATDIITRGYEGAAKSDIRRSAARELLAAYLENADASIEDDETGS